jgi:hypothetical protein
MPPSPPAVCQCGYFWNQVGGGAILAFERECNTCFFFFHCHWRWKKKVGEGCRFAARPTCFVGSLIYRGEDGARRGRSVPGLSYIFSSSLQLVIVLVQLHEEERRTAAASTHSYTASHRVMNGEPTKFQYRRDRRNMKKVAYLLVSRCCICVRCFQRSHRDLNPHTGRLQFYHDGE